jgi:hypothetical protein
MDVESFGHPGWNWKYWLAITDIEGCNQNGRETKNRLAIVGIDRFGHQIGKRKLIRDNGLEIYQSSG